MKKDYFCPACKSLLNLQTGFSAKNPKHMCTECGRIIDVQSGKFPKDDEAEELDLGDFTIKEGKYDTAITKKQLLYLRSPLKMYHRAGMNFRLRLLCLRRQRYPKLRYRRMNR